MLFITEFSTVDNFLLIHLREIVPYSKGFNAFIFSTGRSWKLIFYVRKFKRNKYLKFYIKSGKRIVPSIGFTIFVRN